MSVIELPDDDGTGFDAGDLGTAWLPFTEPRAKDLERLALALLQHAQEMDAAALKEIADERHDHRLVNDDGITLTWIGDKRGEPDAD